jgi:hypothetical protein
MTFTTPSCQQCSYTIGIRAKFHPSTWPRLAGLAAEACGALDRQAPGTCGRADAAAGLGTGARCPVRLAPVRGARCAQVGDTVGGGRHRRSVHGRTGDHAKRSRMEITAQEVAVTLLFGSPAIRQSGLRAVASPGSPRACAAAQGGRTEPHDGGRSHGDVGGCRRPSRVRATDPGGRVSSASPPPSVCDSTFTSSPSESPSAIPGGVRTVEPPLPYPAPVRTTGASSKC